MANAFSHANGSSTPKMLSAHRTIVPEMKNSTPNKMVASTINPMISGHEFVKNISPFFVRGSGFLQFIVIRLIVHPCR